MRLRVCSRKLKCSFASCTWFAIRWSMFRTNIAKNWAQIWKKFTRQSLPKKLKSTSKNSLKSGIRSIRQSAVNGVRTGQTLRHFSRFQMISVRRFTRQTLSNRSTVRYARCWKYMAFCLTMTLCISSFTSLWIIFQSVWQCRFATGRVHSISLQSISKTVVHFKRQSAAKYRANALFKPQFLKLPLYQISPGCVRIFAPPELNYFFILERAGAPMKTMLS